MFPVLICIRKVAPGIYRHCDGCDVPHPVGIFRANIAVVTNISMALISGLSNSR